MDRDAKRDLAICNINAAGEDADEYTFIFEIVLPYWINRAMELEKELAAAREFAQFYRSAYETLLLLEEPRP